MVEKNTVNLAEAMPEDKYNFTPESLPIPGSNYKGVRNFAMEVIATFIGPGVVIPMVSSARTHPLL